MTLSLNREQMELHEHRSEPVAVFREADGQLLYVNKALAAWLQQPPEALLGQPLLSWLETPDSLDFLSGAWEGAQLVEAPTLTFRKEAQPGGAFRGSCRRVCYEEALAVFAVLQPIEASHPSGRWAGELVKVAREHSGLAYWNWNPQTLQIWADAAMFELFEVSRETEHYQNTFLERVVPEQQQEVPQLLKQLAEQGDAALAQAPLSRELELNLPSGKRRVIRSTFSWRSGPEGKLVWGTAQEVTETVVLRQRLELQLEQIQLAAELGKLAFWGQDGEQVWWDENANRLLQRQPGEAPGLESFLSRLHPHQLQEQLTRFEQAHQQALEGTPALVLLRILLPDASERWLDAYIKKVKRRDGASSMIGVIQDVTEREQHLQQIQQNQELRRIVNAGARIGYWEFRVEEDEMHIDEFLQEFLQLPSPLTSADLLTRIHSDSLGAFYQARQEVQDRGEAASEVKLNLPDQPRAFMRTYQREVSRQGARHIIGVTQDITLEVQQREFQRRQERLANLGQLAAEINHDLNQPIAALMMRLTSLEKLLDPAKQERAERVLKAARASLEHARTIAARTLDVARSQSGRREQPLSVIVYQTLELLDTTLRHQNVEVRFDNQWAGTPGVEPRLRVNGKEVLQVLQNLIVNACEALAERAEAEAPQRFQRLLILRLHAREAQVLLEVQDNGSGIPEDVFPHLFEPFYTTKQGTGTGLGLSMCQRLIREHDGTLEAFTPPDGRGACFRITLPGPSAA